LEERMQQLAENLGWPEGPARLPDGSFVFVESYRSQLTIWTAGEGISQYAYTAGAPNSCVVGANGEIYVCQNGGTVGPWRAKEMTKASIQVVDRQGGRAEILTTEIDGVSLNGPNDLAFGPDGRLYFTDPGEYNPSDPEPSYIFALGPDGTGSVVVDFPTPTFPNGLAFDAHGRLVWVESYTGRVQRLREDGGIDDLGRLPGENPVPDGMTVDADGRLYVCDIAGAGIHVLDPEGAVIEFLGIEGYPTNCAFDNETLVVTDAGRLADGPEPSLNGRLWRIELGRKGQEVTLGTISAPTP
jgi:gluconolactonase